MYERELLKQIDSQSSADPQLSCKDCCFCRMDQDKFAVESHKKAAAAAAAGKFAEEIVPVQTTIMDPKTKETKPITVSADDGIRANSSVQSLAKLPPAFKKDGSTTAGNSSQVWLPLCWRNPKKRSNFLIIHIALANIFVLIALFAVRFIIHLSCTV